MNSAALALTLLLLVLATAPVLDALLGKGALARPEFYLLAALYLYSTGGYLTYLILPAGTRGFLLPAGTLSMHTSYLYSVCAILAVYAGGKLYDSKDFEAGVRLEGDRLLTVLALTSCTLALALNVYYFSGFGLFSGGFDRVEFIDDFDATGGAKIPYLTIFYAAIAVLALNERRPASWLMLSGLGLIHLPVGNRRIVLAALIIVFVAKLLKSYRVKKRFLAVMLAVVLAVGIVVGDIRGEGFSALEGFNVQRAFLTLSEFSRPFVTLVYYVENGYEPLYGSSLLYGLVNAIPGFLLPFDKFPAPSREFVEIVDSLGAYGQMRVSGYGFFPVTEALLNFGPIGIPVFFLFFAAFVRWLRGFALRKEYTFIVPLLCAFMFSFGRNPFGGLLASCLWTFAAGIALHFAAQVTREIYGYWHPIGRTKAGIEG